jgi:PKD repeat protein
MAGQRSWVPGLLVVSLCLAVAGCSLFQDQPPVARLTATPLSGVSPLEVEFDASTSSDPDGTVISYAWDFDDGTTGTGRNPSHTFTTATTRTYTAVLTVTDDDGTTGTASQTIEVQAGSTPSGGKPTARFNASPPYGDSPLTVQFDASLSSDPDGVVQVYGWDFGDAKTGSGKVISHTYFPTATTQYTVTLTVTDDDGETATTSSLISVFVTVEVPTDGPTASFTASAPIRIYTSPGRPSTPSLFEVTFDPRASVPSPGHQLKVYYWDFGDGQTTTATTDDLLTHRYASGASSHTYVATLTVVDDQGLSSSTVRNVTVTNPDEL